MESVSYTHLSVGVMYYTALMPCMIASLIASHFAAGMGVTPEAFHVVNIPALSLETGLKMGVVALGCAVISIVFCKMCIRDRPQPGGSGISRYQIRYRFPHFSEDRRRGYQLLLH